MDITGTLTTALASRSRKIRLTFKREAIGDVPYLLGMERGGIVSITASDKMVLMAVISSRNWDRDANRTVLVTLTETFDQEWFTGRMNARAIEKIEAVA